MHACNPSIPPERWRPDKEESKVILGYKVSLRPASATCDPVSKKKKLIIVFIQNERCKCRGEMGK